MTPTNLFPIRWGYVHHSPSPDYVWLTAREAASTPFPMHKNAWGSYDWNFNSTVLEQFSTMCFYFVQAFTDELTGA